MGKPISLFSGYSQEENRTTNYCLLILKMLYDEGPRHLGDVLAILLDADLTDKIGVVFRQQEKRESAIPDGLITQAPVTIYIETKNFDWFYDDQLKRHLVALGKGTPGLRILLAISNFESEETHHFDKIKALCQASQASSDNDITMFAAVSFQKLVDALEHEKYETGISDTLADAIGDFRNYLDEQGLLPTWPRTLDVVNCANTLNEFKEHGVYTCPATHGAYNHRRCKYLGMYRQKRVEYVAEIQAVVEVDPSGSDDLQWANVSEDKDELKRLARAKLLQMRPEAGPTRVFLFGQLYDTDFTKDTWGGMMGSKQYFDISSLHAENAEELAEGLRGREWSEFA